MMKKTKHWTHKIGLIGLLMLAAVVPILAQSKPDHIVVFLADDHGQLDSEPYGATDINTPNMTRLAKVGMKFTHAFIASPACAPSRTAMLTGLMPARTGAEANHTYKPASMTSLPEMLRQLGYQTAAFGKVAHGPDRSNHSFDVSDKSHDAALIQKFFNERDATKPLCLFVGTNEPHVPWPDLIGYDPLKVKLPPTFVDTPQTREFRARYYNDVTKADTLLGQVYDMAHAKLGDNVLFIYSSDHGAQWPFGKWNLYDAGTRVPLIAAWPKVIKPNSVSSAMVQWIDLLPTLIDAVGGTVPDGIDGRSFLPVLRGKTAQHRNEIFTTHSGDGRMNVYPIRSIRTREWKYILNLNPDLAHTTHIDKAKAGDGLKYFASWYERAQTDKNAAAIVKRYYERPAEELYDLRRDPHEQRNLAAQPQHAQRLQAMRAQLEAWMKTQNDSRKVFNQPWPLSDAASKKPATLDKP
ncbi:MAG: sulfatase [Acidobacteria bacterium]|nr:sulfatase [Acidobacteriota bacterium]